MKKGKQVGLGRVPRPITSSNVNEDGNKQPLEKGLDSRPLMANPPSPPSTTPAESGSGQSTNSGQQNPAVAPKK